MSIMDILNGIERRLDERQPESLTVPQAHIADADGSLASATSQLNALLAALEAAGILASS